MTLSEIVEKSCFIMSMFTLNLSPTKFIESARDVSFMLFVISSSNASLNDSGIRKVILPDNGRGFL
jgi:hypothetical protein